MLKQVAFGELVYHQISLFTPLFYDSVTTAVVIGISILGQ
jgi:hypothetical protein